MGFTQENRLIAVITNAGEDVLLLDSFRGKEEISKPYHFVLKMLSEVAEGNPAKVKPHDLVGTSMTVRIDLAGKGIGTKTAPRFFTGMCERFVKEDENDQFASYTAVLVPWFNFLEYSTDHRIFQDMSVPDIIEKVVSQRGYSNHLELRLTKTYTPRAYCVQYRETDCHFLSRLMESEGIYYYFEHKDGDHTMILSDSPQYTPLSPASTFRYSPETGIEHFEDTVTSIRVEEQMHAGSWTHRDYHHEAPRSSFQSSVPSNDVAIAGKDLEVYTYPGDHSKKFNLPGSSGGVRDEGDRLALLEMQREETFHVLASGSSTIRAFATGFKMIVDGGFAAGEYLLTEIDHTAQQVPSYAQGVWERKPYANSFRAIPAKTRYTPPTMHARRTLSGLQTARVIDESKSGNSEEIWPDKYGRVRVRFPWDREEQYACWLRVVQPWAGKSWGQQWIPRVGDEVAVAYLEGDPDCPVIVGGVFNADNMPIFSLPDNKTQSGILTRSTKNGGASNFNMLRFEDKIGNEEIHMQAEKDLNSLVKNAETRTVGASRTSTIHVNDSRTVETGQDAVTVQQGNRTVTVHQKITTISETSDINTTANQHMTAIAQNGNITVEACTGHVSVSSPQSITLTCGGSTISMTPGSISIKSGMVYINS